MTDEHWMAVIIFFGSLAFGIPLHWAVLATIGYVLWSIVKDLTDENT